jgi:FtsP/CotA-like multicopper oxidase with cupredoxin domain
MAAARQFWNGMTGAIIVKGGGGIDALPAVKAAKDRLLVINELILDSYGQVPAQTLVPTAGRVPFYGLPPVPTDIYFPINGILQPRITMRPGEIQRWRVVNGGAHRFIDLAIENQPGDATSAERVPLHQIAQDGINFGASIDYTDLLMAPANRVEFMVQISKPGTYYLKALKFDQGHPGGRRPTEVLATVIVEGQPVRPTTTFPLTLIPPQEDALVPRNPGTNPPDSVWSGQIEVKPVSFFLDGAQFDPTQPRPGNRDVPVGFTEEWVLQNHDVFRHPFHIHVNPFQVLEINGQPTPLPRPWWDTFALPPKRLVKLLMAFRPSVAGKTVFHCHILPHEDAGMMAVLNLRSPTIPFTIPPVGPFDCNAAKGACPPFRPDEPELTPIEPRYVFTQLANQFGASDALPAAISRGGEIQIQLPGDSGNGGTTWSVTLQGNAIAPRGVDFVSSIGQFEGADGIYEFNFDAVKEGLVRVRATTQKPFPWDPAHGQFVLALDVVPPDAIEGRTGRGTFPLIVNRPHFHGAAMGSSRQAITGMSVTVQRPAGTAWDGGVGAQSR